MKNKNLIALSGKKQSGKNTVANIIQYLTSPLDIQRTSFGDFKRYFGKKRGFESNYQQKSFAGKLKQIVSLLTGVSVEDLEKEEVKNSILSEEWWYWYMKLEGGYSPIILNYLTTSKKTLKNYKGLGLIKPTYREILQQLGTNLLRDQFHPDVHINALFSDYNKGRRLKIMNAYNVLDTFDKWILTDPRFPNEIEKVKEHNGITIRIERNTELRFPELWHKFQNQNRFDSWDDYLKSIDKLDVIYHKSETALDSYTDFDYIINNNSDLDSLIEEVRKILIKENII